MHLPKSIWSNAYVKVYMYFKVYVDYVIGVKNSTNLSSFIFVLYSDYKMYRV
jgi:hypothetical protein